MVNQTQAPSQVSVSKENQDSVALNDRLRAWSLAKGKDRDALANEIIRYAQRLNLNDAQTQSLKKLLETPGDSGAELVKSFLELANKRAQQQQELLKKMADDAYTYSAKQGHSLSSMAALYQTLASLARAFGMEDGAVYLENLAANDTVRAKTHLTDERGRLIETGQSALNEGFDVAFKSLLNSNITGKQATLAKEVEKISPVLPGGAPVAGVQQSKPTPSSVSTVKTEDFRKNLTDMGVPIAQVNRVMEHVEEVARKAPGGQPNAIDATVEMKLLPLALTKGGLSNEQRRDLYTRLNLPEPQPS